MTKRNQRVNQLIKEELGKIISRELVFPQDILVTVTNVETSSDLEHAKIKISIMPIEKKERVLEILQKNIYHLQKLLNKKLVMRYVPQIKFEVDKTQEKVEKIEELLKKI
jgi:ribosome-binding factor A